MKVSTASRCSWHQLISSTHFLHCLVWVLLFIVPPPQLPWSSFFLSNAWICFLTPAYLCSYFTHTHTKWASLTVVPGFHPQLVPVWTAQSYLLTFTSGWSPFLSFSDQTRTLSHHPASLFMMFITLLWCNYLITDSLLDFSPISLVNSGNLCLSVI